MNRQDLITAMLATASEPPRKVEVEGWGTVYVRALTVAEVEMQNDDLMEKVVINGKTVEQKVKDPSRLARAAARLLCDENGTRLFDPDSKEDVELLAKQSWKRLRLLLDDPDEKKDEEKKGN